MSTITWIQRNAASPEIVGQLSEQLRNKEAFPPVLAAILLQRGITTYDQAKTFFRPDVSELHDPFLMKDMDLAVDRVLAARQKQEKILLFGDYDVDGTSSVALMLLALRELGWMVEYYIPDRYREGYGLSYQGIEAAEQAGVSLIISLDCGIKAIEKARFAQQKGIDLIICDHHTPGNLLPDAVAVLDPKRKDCPYPFKELTGCGVGMKLLQALTQRLTETEGLTFDPVQAYGDLLVLSIACDIVPIIGENRVLAAMGLEKLRTQPLPGIRALMDQAKDGRSWDISDLVFFLGPRINAAGRLEHASQAVEVLVGEGPQVAELAGALHQSNEARKELDHSMTESALAKIAAEPKGMEKSSTVLYDTEWHKGIIGIVASRVIETHFRPTVLLTQSEEKLVGSARSVPGFDLYQALDACSEHLLQWGGHKYAAGLSLNEADFPAFRDQFEEVASCRRPE
ncbi:MAG: single-stranded-DNA-specific exonuclease RecJ, partial [Bacteroidota bacterium]